MADKSYRQFCPVAMASEILGTRWTPILLRELLAGSTRFNELRRGVPRMSPALLSRRLRELEAAGIIERRAKAGEPDIFEYRLTASGRDLRPVIEALGVWGQRWVESAPSLENLDVDLLMWDMRRSLNPDPLPPRRVVIQFRYPELARSKQRWWLILEPGEPVDLCQVEPGFDVSLYVTVDLHTMTRIWLGLTSVEQAREQGHLKTVGDRAVERAMQAWLGLSPFAKAPKQVR